MSGGETGMACTEARRLLLEGGANARALARVNAHLGRCAGCQRLRDQLHTLRDDLQAAAPPLDDVSRARVLGRLAAALADQAAASGARRVHARGRWVAGAAALAVVAGAVLWLGSRWADLPDLPATNRLAPPPSADLPATNRLAPPPSADQTVGRPVGGPPEPKLAVIEPETVRGGGGALDHLQVRAGERVRARLGPRATATLIGPARLEATHQEAELLEVTLSAGTLVAEYDARAGGRLRIHSPGAVTDVIGTLFSVHAQGAASRIVVARGRVSVRDDQGATRTVNAGQALSIGDVGPLPAAGMTVAERLALDEHDRGPVPAPAPPPVRRSRPARATPDVATAPAPSVPSASRSMPAPAPSARSMPAPAPSMAAPVSPPVPRPSVSAPALPPVAPPPVAPPPAPVTPEQLYQRAEQAMRAGDGASARHELEGLIAQAPQHRLADVARYELAQLALRRGDRGAALNLLEALLASDREPALRQPARRLRCELELEARGGQGRREACPP